MSNRLIAVSIPSLMLAVAALSGCGIGSNVLRGADGKLAPCTGGPHCVSTQSRDPDRKVEPLRYTGGMDAGHARLVAIIKAMPGAAIVTEQADYIHASYTTAVMKYVDDLELVFSAPGVIEVRSSSRIGYADGGLNRRRVEAIRAELAKAG